MTINAWGLANSLAKNDRRSTGTTLIMSSRSGGPFNLRLAARIGGVLSDV
jgi:hypothetical protein